MRTKAILTCLVLAIPGCEKGSGPTTNPDDAAADDSADAESAIPDDEDELDEEPY